MARRAIPEIDDKNHVSLFGFELPKQALVMFKSKQAKPRNTFKTAEEFFSAFNDARNRCRSEFGEKWYLNPCACLKARVPNSWISLKGQMGTWTSPRDVNFPVARFWSTNTLPIGPEYAEFGPLEKNDIRVTIAPDPDSPWFLLTMPPE